VLSFLSEVLSSISGLGGHVYCLSFIIEGCGHPVVFEKSLKILVTGGSYK